ncbi:MAG: toll/interleukin-1 receptor domain-containing protein [Planctomycetes bacterium]|nr:toll/interleukin-1 receptor domain-containing protein [Planctomycetota bacterium]
MSLRKMLTDRVTLVKKDGRRFENRPASVQDDKIFTGDPTLQIEEGDSFERTLPSGLCETYVVTDPGLRKGTRTIPPHYQSKVHRSRPVDPRDHGHSTMLMLFVSHSSKDVEVVKLLVDLIQFALHLRSEEIRCTSVDGYRLPGGADTDESLQREIREARGFIGVISSASVESLYVVFELGARWGARKHLLPVLTPGVDPDKLPGPLAGKNALRCDSNAQLHQLVADLGTALEVTPEPAAAYQAHIDKILACSQATGEDVHASNTPDGEKSTGPATPTLSEEEFDILVAVSKQECATVAWVASTVGISEQKAQYFLDELAGSRDLLRCCASDYVGEPEYYELTHAGRKVLLDRGVL